MTLRPLLLSIQSEVVYGHVGNGAARFALQRLGFEVLALPTVLFSNHPGHGRLKGRAIAGGELRGLLDGLDGLGILRHCGAVLSGYLGAPAHAALVRDAVMRGTTRLFTTGTPAARNTAFARSLCMATADASTPECV